MMMMMMMFSLADLDICMSYLYAQLYTACSHTIKARRLQPCLLQSHSS